MSKRVEFTQHNPPFVEGEIKELSDDYADRLIKAGRAKELKKSNKSAPKNRQMQQESREEFKERAAQTRKTQSKNETTQTVEQNSENTDTQSQE